MEHEDFDYWRKRYFESFKQVSIRDVVDEIVKQQDNASNIKTTNYLEEVKPTGLTPDVTIHDILLEAYEAIA